MKKLNLTVITENQNRLEKAEKLAKLIQETLETQDDFSISKYEKLNDSFKIEIHVRINEEENTIYQAVELTDRICSPWIANFDRKNNSIELIFNRLESSKFRNHNFNVISWGVLQELENWL